MRTMTFEKAAKKAKLLSAYIRHDKITYEPFELKRKFKDYDDDYYDEVLPEYCVVQKFDGQVVWVISS